jgi:hypothetical protein
MVGLHARHASRKRLSRLPLIEEISPGERFFRQPDSIIGERH